MLNINKSLNKLTNVKQKINIITMGKQYVKMSSKYQLVIPSSARKTLNLTNNGQQFSVKKVSKDEIIFKKEEGLEEMLGAFDDLFPEDAVKGIRKIRDTDWD
jgi:bifunctional DNA-binding transcriptional regulator/antitoxin component of YhaV-PrlF toxin-antitoxin module